MLRCRGVQVQVNKTVPDNRDCKIPTEIISAQRRSQVERVPSSGHLIKCQTVLLLPFTSNKDKNPLVILLPNPYHLRTSSPRRDLSLHLLQESKPTVLQEGWQRKSKTGPLSPKKEENNCCSQWMFCCFSHAGVSQSHWEEQQGMVVSGVFMVAQPHQGCSPLVWTFSTETKPLVWLLLAEPFLFYTNLSLTPNFKERENCQPHCLTNGCQGLSKRDKFRLRMVVPSHRLEFRTGAPDWCWKSSFEQVPLE